MEEAERLAFFESLFAQFNAVGSNPRNRRVHTVHRDLERRRELNLDVDERRARMASKEMTRQRQLYEQTRERLKREEGRCKRQEESRHLTLARLDRVHEMRQRTRVDPKNVVISQPAMREEEFIIRYLGFIGWTKSMKELYRPKKVVVKKESGKESKVGSD